MLSNPLFWKVFATLVAVGIAYNWFVAYLERTNRNKNYNALLVVLLSILIIVGIGICTTLETAIVVFMLFCAGGLPCVFGSVAREIEKREKEEGVGKTIVKELLHHDKE
jgi:hypothetical protein